MANPTHTLIASQTVSSAVPTVNFNTFPSTYTDLKFLISARSDTTNGAAGNQDGLFVRFNSSATNYAFRFITADGSTTGSATSAYGFTTTYGWLGSVNSSNGNTYNFSNQELYIPNYASSDYKTYSADVVEESNTTAAYMNLVGGLWNSTSPITSISFSLPYFSANFVTNSTFYLYGIKNS